MNIERKVRVRIRRPWDEFIIGVRVTKFNSRRIVYGWWRIIVSMVLFRLEYKRVYRGWLAPDTQ